MNRTPGGDLICTLKVSFTGKLGRKLLSLVGRPFVRFLRFRPHRARGFRVATIDGEDAAAREKGLAVLSVDHEVSDESLARIPREGPVVAVANHPFGGVEALVLATLLKGIRDDVRVVADHFVQRTPEMSETFLRADPLEKTRAGLAAYKKCIRWVQGGGMLVLFPAREVARIDLKRRAITDPKWRRAVGRIVRETGAPVLPIFFSGANSALFQILGLVHYRLSSVVLPNELFNRQRKQIQIRTGSLIPPAKLKTFTSSEGLTAYLRMRTDILRSRDKKRPAARKSRSAPMAAAVVEEIAPPGDPETVAAEVAALPTESTLAKMGELAVLLARASEIPLLLHEIGRLREITFREVNEGTGKRLDLDEFDDTYFHLIVWNTEKQELVGAYRLGLTDELLERSGPSGLYTSTLFEFKPGMLDEISPAAELGRSFIRSEYQKSYAPLMLLWKGIGEFLIRNPDYKFLFGPVSINDQYNSMSRRLMIRFLKENNYMRDLAKLVKAKTPMRARSIRGVDVKAAGGLPNNIEEFSALISDIEADQKGVPILFRQYLRLGGKLLGCNIDPDFSNVLDALLLVDVTETDPKILIRYMGKEGAEGYLAYHRKRDAGAPA